MYIYVTSCLCVNFGLIKIGGTGQLGIRYIEEERERETTIDIGGILVY